MSSLSISHNKTVKKRPSHKRNNDLWNNIKSTFSLTDSYDHGSLQMNPENNTDTSSDPTQMGMECVYSASSNKRENCDFPPF